MRRFSFLVILSCIFSFIGTSESFALVPAADTALVSPGSYASGSQHTCVITSLGRVRCQGSNTFGELTGDTAPNLDFVNVDLPRPAIFIAAQGNATCALTDTKNVYCWGDDTYGRISFKGSKTPVRTPRLIAGLPTNLVKIGLTGFAGVALTDDGQMWTWGAPSDSYGSGLVGSPTYLGREGSTSPGLVTRFGSPLRDFAAAMRVICGLTETGTTMCFGSNSDRNIGYRQVPGAVIGSYTGINYFSSTPQPAENLPTTGASITVVGTLICTTMKNHEVWCWGTTFNAYDYRKTPQAGVGARYSAGHLNVPQLLFDASSQTTVLQSAADSYVHCAKKNTDIYCWGWGETLTLDSYVITPKLITGISGATLISAGMYPSRFAFFDSNGDFALRDVWAYESGALTVESPGSFAAWDDQAISIDAPTSISVGEVSRQVLATSSSTLPVSITENSNSCQLINGQVLGLLNGTCRINFSQSGNSRYQPVARSFEISVSGIPPENLSLRLTDKSTSQANIGMTLTTGGLPTTIEVEYSTTSTFSNALSASTQVASSTGQVTASIQLTQLLPGQVYYVRASTSNSAGQVTSELLQFKTNGSVATIGSLTVSEVSSTSVRITSSIIPNDLDTNYWLQFSTNRQMSTFNSSAEQIVRGSDSKSVQVLLSGLSEGTKYFARLIAENSLGRSISSIVDFVSHTRAIGDITTFDYTPNEIGKVIITADVNPGGGTSRIFLQYSTTNNFSNGFSSSEISQISGYNLTSVQGEINGLRICSRYFARLQMINDSGTSVSPVSEFWTSAGNPVFNGLKLSNVASGIVAVESTFQTSCIRTVVNVQWNQIGSSSQNSQSFVVDGSLTSTVFTSNISGLTPGVSYLFRVNVSNAVGHSDISELSILATTSPSTLNQLITPPLASSVTTTNVATKVFSALKTLGKKKTAPLSSFISYSSPGTKTWKVSGGCRIVKSKLQAPARTSTCKLTLTVRNSKKKVIATKSHTLRVR